MEELGGQKEVDIKAYQVRAGQLIFMESDAHAHQNCQNAYPNHPEGCPEFGHNWGCPPYAPPIAETKASLETYPYLWLVVATLELSRNKIKPFKRWSDNKKYRRLTLRLNLFLDYLRESHRDWIVFSCSHCEICRERGLGPCPCPGRPCRFPDDIRVSPEAAGIDIFATLRQIGIHLHQVPDTEAARVALIATDERINVGALFAEYEMFLKIKGKFEGNY